MAFTMLIFLTAGFMSQVSLAAAQGALEGPFDDGCYYLWNGSQYTEGQCPQPDGSVDVYSPSANGWIYSGIFTIDANGIKFYVSANGAYMEIYPDGSIYFLSDDGVTYGVIDAAGVFIEIGYLDNYGNHVMTGYNDGSGAFVSVAGSNTSTGSVPPNDEAVAQLNKVWLDMTSGNNRNQTAPACTGSINGC